MTFKGFYIITLILIIGLTFIKFNFYIDHPDTSVLQKNATNNQSNLDKSHGDIYPADTIVVYDKQIILFKPTEARVNALIDYYGEDNFYISADDNSYYLSQARNILIRKSFPFQEIGCDIIIFKNIDTYIDTVATDTLGFWGAIFFDGKKKPVICDITDIEFSIDGLDIK